MVKMPGQLSETLLFLGAGASKPFGLPTMKEMFPELKRARHVLMSPDVSSLCLLSTIMIDRCNYGIGKFFNI